MWVLKKSEKVGAASWCYTRTRIRFNPKIVLSFSRDGATDGLSRKTARVGRNVNVPSLNRNDAKRNLNLNWFDNDWPDNWRLLGLATSPDSPALLEREFSVKAAVFPLLKNKPELVDKAREIYRNLKKEIPQIMWDDNGNVGKRYRRQDEIGTPFCITIDFDTLGENPDLKDTVTLRDRDTGEQQRMKISELAIFLLRAIKQ